MLGHVAGMVDLVALPLWVGTLVQHHGMDFEHAGLTVTLFLLGAVFASAVLAPRFDRLPQRACAITGFTVAGVSLYSVSHAIVGFGLGVFGVAFMGAVPNIVAAAGGTYDRLWRFGQSWRLVGRPPCTSPGLSANSEFEPVCAPDS